MRIIGDKVQGPHTVEEDTTLHGMIDGDAIVPSVRTLIVHGMITGDLRAERDSVVEIHGMVVGSVINRGGQVKVFGMVGAIIDEDSEIPTLVAPHAVVLGRRDS